MKKLYVIGDSISMQYGPYLERALHGVMHYARKEGETEGRLSLDHPQGANGGDSIMVLAFLQGLQQLGGFEADLLLVNCGLHDIKIDPVTGTKQVDLATYQQNLRAIVATARAMGPTLVWVRTTPCDEQVHNHRHVSFHRFAADCALYNQAADEIMTAAGVPLIDLYTFTVNLGPDLYYDHVHFHETIRAQQGAFIAGWLNHWLSVMA
jgi:lysophospholipase L1-like esterase